MLLIAQRAVCIRAVSRGVCVAWLHGYAAQHCTRYNGYACNFASCTGGHVALTRALIYHLKCLHANFKLYNSFLNKLLEFNNACLLNDKFVIPVCSHAIRKILMVWVRITWDFQPHVIQTQTINIFSYCMSKCGTTNNIICVIWNV